MSELPNFTNLRVWQQAHKLTIEVYRVTKHFPTSEQYGLISQMQRAAVSVESNIAEGSGRYHYNDSSKFFVDARASACETQTQTLIAQDLSYIKPEEAEFLLDGYTQLIKQINSLIKFRRSRKIDSRA